MLRPRRFSARVPPIPHPSGRGIRCLLGERIRVQVSGKEHLVRPGEAWLEAGPDPSSRSRPSANRRPCARMVLPAELRGKSGSATCCPKTRTSPSARPTSCSSMT